MASKSKTVYVCTECGFEQGKWSGKCPSCGSWNTLEETVALTKPAVSPVSKNGIARSAPAKLSEIRDSEEIRFDTGIGELNRVLGGGLVKGSLVLLAGEPGIGKSTILLQMCSSMRSVGDILYVSGEESRSQIKLRAKRLGVDNDSLYILCDTDAEYIKEVIADRKPDLVLIDSVQTMTISEIQSSAGSVTQVRESTNLFMHTAKSLDIPIILVGHVNKDGNIAGPKVLEHIVDTVLYFEGDKAMSYRILRADKNRFGSTNEIGVFIMSSNGLEEVPNPSAMLLDGRPKNTSGACVVSVMEGSRSVLAEVQALVTPTNYGSSRRMSNGFDFSRMSMIIAVLEKRAGYYFANTDVYLNIVGGLKINETASDLPVALSLVSSLKDTILKDDVLAIGEIGLAGEIRGVTACEQRVNEALRMGFTKIIVPAHNFRQLRTELKKAGNIVPVSNIREAFRETVL